MNCLCCGRPLREPIPSSDWHPACIRHFFSSRTLPEIEPTADNLTLLAEKSCPKWLYGAWRTEEAVFTSFRRENAPVNCSRLPDRLHA